MLSVGILQVFGSINLWASDPNTIVVASVCIGCAFSIQWDPKRRIIWMHEKRLLALLLVLFVTLQLHLVDLTPLCTDETVQKKLERHIFRLGFGATLSNPDQWTRWQQQGEVSRVQTRRYLRKIYDYTCGRYDTESKGFFSKMCSCMKSAV